jgi:hypothetical protein
MSSAGVLPYITLKNFSHLSSISSLENITYLFVSQSSSLTITSCEESQSFLVKYQDSAVLRAVSAFHFLHE